MQILTDVITILLFTGVVWGGYKLANRPVKSGKSVGKTRNNRADDGSEASRNMGMMAGHDAQVRSESGASGGDSFGGGSSGSSGDSGSF